MKSNMTIGKKLWLTGGVLLALTAIIGAVALTGLGRISRSGEMLADDALAGVTAASQVQAALFEMRGDFLEHIGSKSASDMDKIESHIDGLKHQIDTDLSGVGASIQSDEERQLFARIKPALAEFYQIWDEVRPVSRASHNEEAYQMFYDRTAKFTAVRDAVKAETDYNRNLGTTEKASMQSTQSAVRWTVWIGLIVGFSGGSALLFWIIRGVNGALLDAVNRLSEGATHVASAAEQVSSSSQSLAQGSSEQAASLEQTSACAEEISSMSRKNSDNCHAAASLVAESQNQFELAGQSLRDMVQAMNEINDSSGKISKIIKVIDEIAFQTNILALNAAVEAARAGEAGMGFAVVADEVRNLAQRCAQAARDTSGLIEESIDKSREGKLKVDSVAEGVASIAEQVTRAKSLMDEVYAASQEQVRGIGEMAQAISQMERVTQSSAASAEEGAAAAAELNTQSEGVVRVVNDLTALVGGSSGRV